MSDAAGESYVFFLSYARADSADGFLETFFEDLRETVRGLTGQPLDRIGFRDTSDIQLGERWPEELEKALSSSQALLCLFSPTYFTREACGKEMALFFARLDEAATEQSGRLPLILPVQWIPPRGQYRELPFTIQELQYSHEDLGTLYAQKGLRYLLSVGEILEYRRLLESLASKLVEAVERHALPPRTPPLRLKEFRSAFEGDGSRPPDPRGRSRTAAEDPRADLDAARGLPVRREDFLALIETVLRYREPKAQVERIPGTGPAGDHLRVFLPEADLSPVYPIGGIEHGLDREALQRFLTEIDAPYRRIDPGMASVLVYGGEAASPDLLHEARQKRVRLMSFVEYQGLIDFRLYVARQTAKLVADPYYPPRLYVPQRMTHITGPAVSDEEIEDALAQVRDWLDTPHGRFVLVLGEFGTGKTFLLHELARRMAEEGSGPVPILLQMRALEKGRSLDALLAQHFALEEVDDFNPRKFRYMLEQGRVALLFDGFDELALRVTYPKATEHFDTILQAAGGNAKVILTSRRQHFLSEAQVKNALGERVDLVPGNRIALLRPFDREQIRRFLVGFCGDETQAEARLKLIESVNDLMGLSHNPRMLGFIAELPEDSLLAARQGNREITAAELYRLILTRWLEGEVDRVQPRGARPGLSIEDRWEAVTALARRLWQKSDPFISLAELEEDTARVLESLGAASLEPDVAAFQVASGTLLVRDEEGRFAFLHQSILEWLVAREAAQEIESGGAPETLSSRDLSPLMADFLIDLCDSEFLKVWLLDTSGARSDERTRNVLLVAQRMERSRSTPAGEAGGSIEILSHGLRGVDLSGQDLSGADFSEADFTDAVLIETLLIGANLQRARLAGAQLIRADLTNADLSGADLTGADLTGARLIGADLHGARFESVRWGRAKLLGARWDASSSPAHHAAASAGAALDDLQNLGAVVARPILSEGGDMAWSPDGGILAAAEGACALLWEASTGQEIRHFGPDSSALRVLALSPGGGQLASGSNDGAVCVWDLATGEEVHRLENRASVFCLSFSPDGSLLACGLANGWLALWNVRNGKKVRQVSSEAGAVLRLVFHQDGSGVLAFTLKGGFLSWSLQTGKVTSRVTTESKDLDFVTFKCLSFSPDCKSFAAGAYGGNVSIHDTSTGKRVRQLEGHRTAVQSVCFDPAGRRLASGSDDETIRLWDLSKGRELYRIQEGPGLSNLSFSPDDRVLASRSASGVRLWEAATGRELRTLRSLGMEVVDVRFDPSGRSLVSASPGAGISIWDLASGQENLRLCEAAHPRVVVFDRQGERVLGGGGYDRTQYIWDAVTGRVLQTLESQTLIRSAEFSPSGHRVVSAGGDEAVTIWKVATGKEIRRLETGAGTLQTVTFSPDGRRIAAGSLKGLVCVWGTGRALRQLEIGHSPVESVHFSADGAQLACGTWDGAIRVWSLEADRELNHFEGHARGVNCVRFSPQGQTLASGSEDATVRLWKLSTGREIGRLEGHEAAVRSVSFSPDGRLLASASSDGTIRLWKVANGACLAILAPLPEGWAAFAPDGRYKLGGVPGGAFWHVINLCRFEPGELDDLIPGLRLADNASFLDLPPWKAELRRDMAWKPGATEGDTQG